MTEASAESVRERVRVPIEGLRWTCPEECLRFETTDGVAPVEGTIGQDRALEALRIGLELYSPGYNIFVSGLVGTGRSTTVKEILREISPRCAVPRDRAYVRNFADPDRPRLLTFSAGRAAALREEMEEFRKHVRTALPSVFEDKDVARRRDEIVNRYGEKEQEILKEFQERLKADGFSLVSVQSGPVPRPDVFPTHEGEPMPLQKFEELVREGKVAEEKLEEVHEKIEEHQSELRDHMRRGRSLAREMGKEIEDLNREVGLSVIEGHLEDLREQFGDNPPAIAFLSEVEKDVLDSLPVLAMAEDPEGVAERHMSRYEVNIISDHSRTRGCPVVVASNPTHTSLFGTIERVMEAPGLWRTDHTMIKGGSLLEADGGYLIVYALDILQQPGVWPTLMRGLKSGFLEIGIPDSPFIGITSGLKPEPIDLNVKVVLIGEPAYYDMLYRHDPDFRKIFKVKADFTPDMRREDENLEHFTKVVARICEKEALKPLSREAMGLLVEEGVRAAGRKDRLTTRFADVADVLREANYWCLAQGGDVVTLSHVREALEKRRYRNSLMDSRIQDLMEKDVLIIRTEGEAVGQVNGLSVYDLGYARFGKPTLITAATAVGQAGIISIEREARLSGGIYDKGVLIISGYLRRLFARTRPLALTASICFEQSYSGVDGDSASIAEIFALLSDLSEIPIDSGIAVTGSINQRGQIQPIGGANEKIEGFFRLCRARGLTGKQGVIIPSRNVDDLMLRREVVDAAKEGRFHVWAISSVEEGIEILTGVPAGERDENGEYPEGTVFRFVDERLASYLDALRGKDDADWKPIRAVEVPAELPEPPPPPGLPPRPVSEEDTDSRG